MIYFIIIFIIIVITFYLVKNSIHIDFKSFFRKGFHKFEDDFGLYCFTAVQGGGKTYSICDLTDRVFKDKIIISNVESFCKHRPNNTLYMTDFNKIVDFIDSSNNPNQYIIFFDEIFSAMGVGTGRNQLNEKSRRFLTQLRKRKLHILTSCQDWGVLPRDFRKLCRFQINCKIFNFLRFGFAIVINEVNSGYDIKWDNELQDYVAPRIQTNIRKASLKVANSYDTYETIANSSILTLKNRG